MIVEPERYISEFASAGADIIIVHQEVSMHLHRTLAEIHRLGKKAGVAINPATPLSSLQEVLNDADLVLCMTVDPGFGGQSFISNSLSKIQRLRTMIEQHHASCDLEVDGGISVQTAALATHAGANVLVAGTAVFGHPEGIAAGITALRESAS